MKNPRIYLLLGFISLICIIVNHNYFESIFDDKKYLGSKINVHQIYCKGPTAKIKPESYYVGEHAIQDDYLWLKNYETDGDVVDYIKEENNITDFWFRQHVDLAKQVEKELNLFQQTEWKNPCLRLDLDMDSMWHQGSFVYWISIVEEYPVYYRRRTDFDTSCSCLTGNETDEIVLDLNTILSSGVAYYMVGVFEVEEEANLVAFSLDLVGNEKFVLQVMDIDTKEILCNNIQDTYYSAAWKSTLKDGIKQYWIYYNVVSKEWGIPIHIDASGPFKSSQPSKSIRVYSESDIAYTTELYLTTDETFLFIFIHGQVSSEYIQIIHQGDTITLKTVMSRKVGITYKVEHNQGYFYILTNSQGAENYQIIRTLINNTLDQKIIVKHDHDVYIERMEMMKSHMLLWFRKESQRHIRIVTISDPLQIRDVIFSNVHAVLPNFEMDIDGRNRRKFDSNCMLYLNSSFVTATSVYSLDLSNGKSYPLVLRKRIDQEVYTEKQLFAPINNISSIPISIVYKQESLKKIRPLIVIAYGAYGTCIDTLYEADLIPFLNRDYIWAICHPRGDGDNGGAWYKNGKFENKINTFSDVNSCVNYLVELGMVDSERVIIKGRSAGGLVAGNAIVSPIFTIRPKVVIGHVPFNDPLYDLIDPKVPWTAYEWSEWGDPLNHTIFNTMIEYSPYYNIKATTQFPAIYFSSGLTDSRVPYWEPLKFIAKVRKYSCKRAILMRITSGGHFSASLINDKVEWITFALENNNK